MQRFLCVSVSLSFVAFVELLGLVYVFFSGYETLVVCD
jgi:hypothetical protein